MSTQIVERDPVPRKGSKLALLRFLLLGYYLPVTLVPLGIVPFPYRYAVFGAMALCMAAYTWRRGFSARQLGLRRDTLIPGLAWNGAATVMLAAAMLWMHHAHLLGEGHKPDWRYFFVFYVFVSSPVQEFLFRSIPFAEMSRTGVYSPFGRVAISALTFCYVHVMYWNAVTLAVTLVAGILWGITYQKYPSFWGVALSHAAVGAVSIHVGLV